jgi:hypothetical protein
VLKVRWWMVGVAFLGCGAGAEAQVPNRAVALSIPVALSDGTTTQTLYFGLDPLATDTLDSVLGESELPPLPPSEVLDTRFVGFDIGINLGLGTVSDYRKGDAATSGTRIHELAFQVAPGKTLRIQWAFPPGVKAVVQDLILGTFVQFTMEGTGSYTLTNPSVFGKLKMTVQYASTSLDVPELEPRESGLYQNFPNPFNPVTTIPFQLTAAGHVTLEVYDLPGRKVVELLSERMDAGWNHVGFDARGLASGVYLYRLSAGDFVAVKRLTVLR